MSSRMSRIVLGAACTLVCAAAGAAGATAAPKPKPVLHLEAGGVALAPGAPLTLSGTSFKIVSGAGTVNCDLDELSGSMTTNLTKKDLVTFESGLFGGEGEEGSCQSNYASPRNEAVVLPEVLPWELHLSSKGAAELKAPPTELKGGIEVRLKPLHPPPPPHGSVSCLYNSAKFKTTFGIDGEPVVLTFTNIEFHVTADSAGNCGKESPRPKVSATFALTSEGQPVTATVGP
jgi:hypothetical protein